MGASIDMGIFGWSYPPGCSGPPWDDIRDDPQPKCEECGGFLTTAPTRVESDTLTMPESSSIKPKPGPGISNIRRQKVEEIWGDEYLWTFDVQMTETIEVRVCKRCGCENKTIFI